MDRNVMRILDANLNRAREALRVLEDHARMILDDAALCERVKGLRHTLATAARQFGADALLAARDTPGDVGTTITSDSERRREGPEDVARAAAKRAGEAMRSIEEYGKIASADAAAAVEAGRYELYAIEQAMFLGSPRRLRLRRAQLHVLITASLCRGRWDEVAEAALCGGANVLQLREKGITDREWLDRARRLRELTRAHNALLIINDRPDIAVLADADGVHLGQEDLHEDDARRIVGPARLVGVTVHSTDEARSFLGGTADYFGVGPMFASPTKPGVAVNGPKLVRDVHGLVRDASSSVPLVAIGGITSSNAAGLAEAFRDLIGPAPSEDEGVEDLPRVPIAFAVCQAVIAAADPAGAASSLRAAIEAGFSTNNGGRGAPSAGLPG